MAVSARAKVCARAVPMHASMRGWDARRTEGGSRRGAHARRLAAGGCAMHGPDGVIEPKSTGASVCQWVVLRARVCWVLVGRHFQGVYIDRRDTPTPQHMR
jgi:hypothetical protein